MPRGRFSARDGIGARVQVDVQGASLIREVNRNSSYEVSSELAVSFGLGDQSVVQKLEVKWPSGISHSVHYLPADQTYTVVEPLVTAGPGSGLVGDVVEGTTAVFQLELQNRTAKAQTVWHVPQVRVFGTLLWSGPPMQVTVAGDGDLTLTRELALPLGTADLSVEFLWAVYDSGLGIDQLNASFEITRSTIRDSLGGSLRRISRKAP